MNLEQCVYEKVMEKLAYDFRGDAVEALAKYRKDRDDALQSNKTMQFLHRAGEQFHEHVSPLLSGPMTSPAGHIGSGESRSSRIALALAGMRGGPQAAPIITLHELDEASGGNPDAMSGDKFKEFIKKQIIMNGSPSVTIGSHVGPYVLMNENNRLLQIRDEDPKTFDMMNKIRNKEDKIFNWVINKSESNHLKSLVPGLPGYGERPYTDAEIEAANNAIVDTKDAQKLVKNYREGKKYHPEIRKNISEAMAIAAPALAVYGVYDKIKDTIKAAKEIKAMQALARAAA